MSVDLADVATERVGRSLTHPIGRARPQSGRAVVAPRSRAPVGTRAAARARGLIPAPVHIISAPTMGATDQFLRAHKPPCVSQSESDVAPSCPGMTVRPPHPGGKSPAREEESSAHSRVSCRTPLEAHAGGCVHRYSHAQARREVVNRTGLLQRRFLVGARLHSGVRAVSMPRLHGRRGLATPPARVAADGRVARLRRIVCSLDDKPNE